MSLSLRTVASLAFALAATVGHADTLEKVKSAFVAKLKIVVTLHVARNQSEW
jgi:hypothetical protein